MAMSAEIIVIERDRTVVKDKEGNIYNFMHGSINAVRYDMRKVGRKGWIRWVKTPSASFPSFSDSREPFGKFVEKEK